MRLLATHLLCLVASMLLVACSSGSPGSTYCNQSTKARVNAFLADIPTPHISPPQGATSSDLTVTSASATCDDSTDEVYGSTGFATTDQTQSAVVTALTQELAIRGWTPSTPVGRETQAAFRRTDDGKSYWAEILAGPDVTNGPVSLIVSAGVAPE